MKRRLLAAALLGAIASVGFGVLPSAMAESYGTEAAGKGAAVTIDQTCDSLGDGWVRILGPINTPRGTMRVCQKGLN